MSGVGPRRTARGTISAAFERTVTDAPLCDRQWCGSEVYEKRRVDPLIVIMSIISIGSLIMIIICLTIIIAIIIINIIGIVIIIMSTNTMAKRHRTIIVIIILIIVRNSKSMVKPY